MTDSAWAFMGGRNVYGRWVPEQHLAARAFMGGVVMDFSQAIFTHPQITIDCTAFQGGVTIIVPPNVAVEQNGRAIMGAFAGSGGLWHSNEGQSPDLPTIPTAAVTVVVNGTAVMGSISAACNKRAAPAQLVSAEEAARILREVPAPAPTFPEGIIQQQIGEAGYQHQAAVPPPMPPVAVQGTPVAVDSNGFKAAAASAPVAAPVDWKKELKELKEMADGGILTDDEFQTQKTRILASAEAAVPGDWKKELKELKEMVGEGILTEDEFSTQKARILATAQ